MCLHEVNGDNFTFKGNDEAIPVCSMKAYRGRRGVAALILKLGSMNRRLCGPQS